MKLQNSWFSTFILAVGLAAPALIHGLMVFTRFDGLYGQDPFAYFSYAIGPLREAILSGGLPPEFFWPPGYPLAVLAASIAAGLQPVAGQIVSLASAALLPIITFLLARAVIPNRRFPNAPLLAGLLVALNPQLWQSSVVVMSDTLALTSATSGIMALAMFVRQKSFRRSVGLFCLSIGLISFAIITRWAYLLLAIPAAIFAAAALLRKPPRVGITSAVLGSIVGIIVLWPVISPHYQSLISGQINSSAFIGDLKVYSWNPINAFRRHFFTPDGMLNYNLPNGLYYSLAPGHVYFFTPLLAIFLVPGLYTLVRFRSLAYTLLIGGWACVIFLFHAGAPWQNFRFTLAYLPPVAILVASGISWLLTKLPNSARGLVWIPVGIGLLWMIFGGINLTNDFVERKSLNLQTVTAVSYTVPSSSNLIAFNLTSMLDHYTSLNTFELFYLDQQDLNRLITNDQPTYLLIDLANIKSQWQDRPPGTNLAWLESNATLEEIQDFGNFRLFSVNAP